MLCRGEAYQLMRRESHRDWVDFCASKRLSGVELLRAHYEGHAYERHSHETYAIGVTEAGVQSFNYRGAAHASTSGSVMIFNPEEPHDGAAGTCEGFTYRMLYVPPEVAREVLEDANDGRAVELPYAAMPLVQDRELSIRTLHAYAALRHDDVCLAADAAIADLFVALTDRLCRCRTRQQPAALSAARLATVRALLRDTPLAEPITGADLIHVSGLSRYHLSRSFQRAYGLPPHAYRLQRRLAEAQRLLAAGSAPAEVAAEVGFCDQSHLNRRFKAAFGLTPMRYRSAYRAACS